LVRNYIGKTQLADADLGRVRIGLRLCGAGNSQYVSGKGGKDLGCPPDRLVRIQQISGQKDREGSGDSSPSTGEIGGKGAYGSGDN